MPTQNLAIMFTDIKGFTARVSSGKREDLKQLLTTHERLLAPVITYYDGTIVKTIGDAFLARFDSPTEAVLCGVTIQEVLRQHNAFVKEEEQLLVRVAINAGDVELIDGDVAGEVVNLAARLEGIAEAGEVYFTEAVYLAMNRHEAPSAEIGERTFAGIPYPVRVYKVIRDPNSGLAKRVAAGVRMTDRGPVFKGLHETRTVERRRHWFWVAAAAAVLLVPAALWFYHARTAPPEEQKGAIQRQDAASPAKPEEKTAALPGKTIVGQPIAPPHRKASDVLGESRRQLDELAGSQGAAAALEWLNKRLEQNPELEPLRKEIPPLEAKAAGDHIVQKSLRGEEMTAVVDKLLARYSTSPSVPSVLARTLEGKVSPEYYPVHLYKVAIERGADPHDPHIQEFCLGLLEHHWPGWLDETHDLLQRYFDTEAASWARRTADQADSGVALANARRILGRHKDPRLNDPLYRAVFRATEGYENEAEAKQDLDLFRQVADRKRQLQILSIYRWVFSPDKAVTSFGYSHKDLARRNLEALEALWGKP